MYTASSHPQHMSVILNHSNDNSKDLPKSPKDRYISNDYNEHYRVNDSGNNGRTVPLLMTTPPGSGSASGPVQTATDGGVPGTMDISPVTVIIRSQSNNASSEEDHKGPDLGGQDINMAGPETANAPDMDKGSLSPCQRPHNPHKSQPQRQQSQPLPQPQPQPQQEQQQYQQPAQHQSAGQLAMGAAANAQQPKVVQTAFIHKLYSMLQDPNIQHLITWSSSNESFLMNPSSEFSKVLSQYFKHTNVSSFVRQLNMYGFHKVSDVFHNGSPDSTMWEFKHGNGNFKKGDVAGLREIKRRASRHTLIHRDSFSAGGKHGSSQPGPPADSMDQTDSRFASLENSLHDTYNRLVRMEESHASLTSKCEALTENLVRCHQWSSTLSHFVARLLPEESSARQEVMHVQKDVEFQLDALHNADAASPYKQGYSRQPFYDNGSVSPRQVSQDNRRRRSRVSSYANDVAPRPYGSFSGTSTAQQPSSRAQLPPPSQPFHPHVSSHHSNPQIAVNLTRRHTSADIREHGWLPNNSYSHHHQPPYHLAGSASWGNLQTSSKNDQSPSGVNNIATRSNSNSSLCDANGSPNEVRDILSRYELGGGGSRRAPSLPETAPVHSQQRQQSQHLQPHPSSTLTTPHHPSTLELSLSFLNSDGSWNSGSSGNATSGSRFPHHSYSSLPATRRSSMASNVHSLLNPAETAECSEEDEDMETANAYEERKRKRLQ